MKTIKLQEENYNVLVNLLQETLKRSESEHWHWEYDYENINEYRRTAKTKERIIERYEYFTNRINQLKNLIKDLEVSI